MFDARYLVPILMLLTLMVGMPRAHAQTPTTTAGTNPEVHYYISAAANSTVSGSYATTCTMYATAMQPFNSQTIAGYVVNTSNCELRRVSDGGVVGSQAMLVRSCSISYVSTSAETYCTTPQGGSTTCPGNSVLSGSGSTATCSCPSGSSSWNGSMCVSACAAGTETEWRGDVGPNVALPCVNGCTVKHRTTICGGSGTLRHCTGYGQVVGLECTTPTVLNATNPNPCSQGEYPMLINGTQLCASTGYNSEIRNTSTLTNADGSQVVTSSSTACADGRCVSSATMTPYTAGGAAGAAETEEKSENKDFTMGTPVDTAVATTPNSLSSITPFSLGSARVCPAAIPLPKGAEFSFDGACFVADGLRPVLLALAWLAAGLIAFGAKTE